MTITIAELKARSIVDPATHCWIWQGARNERSLLPMIYTIDYRKGDKRSISGPLAVWMIAHEEAPTSGHFVYRACGCPMCVNPAHMRLARSRAEIGQHIARSGRRKGTCLAQRRANARLAAIASGQRITPPEVVAAIRAADSSVTGVQLAATHGISPQSVSRIRRCKSHRQLLGAA